MAILPCAQRFFSWFRMNKNSIVVLLYASSFALFAFGLIIISVNEFLLMLETEPIRTPQSEVIFPSDYFEPNSFSANMFDTYQYTDFMAFIILMAGTTLLLHHYSKKIGRIKFWIIISLPILYEAYSSLVNFGLIALQYRYRIIQLLVDFFIERSHRAVLFVELPLGQRQKPYVRIALRNSILLLRSWLYYPFCI